MTIAAIDTIAVIADNILPAMAAIASFVKAGRLVPYIIEVVFIVASIKDDVVAGIIAERIVGVEVQTATTTATTASDAAAEEELLVVVEIGFGSWQSRGLTNCLVGVREDHLY